MRVIAGKYRRRALEAPEGTELTRPTSDRVKESVFNILAPHLDGAIALDLFAGSGALGIEALSRGAAHAIFVEKNPKALAVLKRNLEAIKAPPDTFTVVPADVDEFLMRPNAFMRAKSAHESFAASINLVLADPPYALGWYDGAIPRFEASGLCASDCLAVFEMSHGRQLPLPPDAPWERIDERTYGKTRLELWQRNHGEG